MNFVIAIFSALAGTASIFAGINADQPASTIWFIGAGLWFGNAVANIAIGLTDL